MGQVPDNFQAVPPVTHAQQPLSIQKPPLVVGDREDVLMAPLPRKVPPISAEKFNELRALRYDPNTDDGEEPIVTIGFEKNGVVNPICNEGNALLIYGLYGTRKSTLQKSMKAAILSGNRRYGPWVIPKDHPNGILAFDTEQPVANWKTGERDVYKILNESQDMPKYNSIPLSQESDLASKIAFVLEYMYRCNAGKGSLHEDIGYVFIDQIGDLIADGNDEPECKSLWNSITAILGLRKMTLITTLHTEKTGRTTRGSAGSISEQKAASAIKLEKDNPDEPTKLSWTKHRLAPHILPVYFAQGIDSSVNFSDDMDTARQRMNAAIRHNQARSNVIVPPVNVFGQPSLNPIPDPRNTPPSPVNYNEFKKDDDFPF